MNVQQGVKMTELYDEKGNLQIPLEGIADRLLQKITQQQLEIATLQTANGILTEELAKYKEEKK